jgi:ABC-type Na+ efflux pump permease subunit
MRWSIIRLIWQREIRDQLRDRRTVFMIAVLPLVLYPLIGLGLLQLAKGFSKKSNQVGVVGAKYLPGQEPLSSGVNPLPAVAWLGLNPEAGPCSVAGVAGIAQLAQQGLGQADAPLILWNNKTGRIPSAYFDTPRDAELLPLKSLDLDGESKIPDYLGDLDDWIKEVQKAPVFTKDIDVLVLIPPDFQDRINRGERGSLAILTRPGDEHS